MLLIIERCLFKDLEKNGAGTKNPPYESEKKITKVILLLMYITYKPQSSSLSSVNKKRNIMIF